MKVIVNGKEFKSVVKELKAIYRKKVTIPILKEVKIVTENDGINFTISNSDVIYSKKVKAVEIVTSGSMLLPFEEIEKIVKKVKTTENVTLSVINENTACVEISNNLFNLHTEEVGYYPIISEIKNKIAEIDYSMFKNMIEKISYAVSKMESRPILTGIKVELSDKKIKAVSCDSFRLACSEISCDSIENNVECVISSALISAISKLNLTGKIKIYLDIDNDRIGIIDENGSLLQSNLLTGNYPDTSRLIPREFEGTFSGKNEKIVDIMDKATLIDDEIILTQSSNDVQFETHDHRKGNSFKRVEKFECDGNIPNVVFQAKYLKEALINSTDNVKIEFVTSLKPFVVTSDFENMKVLHLITPIRKY